MAPSSQREKEDLAKLARRGLYCLVMGAGAIFAYFNSIHGWVTPSQHNRSKDAWLEPLMPTLEPYLPQIVVVPGIAFLAYAAFCFFRYITLAKGGG